MVQEVIHLVILKGVQEVMVYQHRLIVQQEQVVVVDLVGMLVLAVQEQEALEAVELVEQALKTQDVMRQQTLAVEAVVELENVVLVALDQLVEMVDQV